MDRLRSSPDLGTLGSMLAVFPPKSGWNGPLKSFWEIPAGIACTHHRRIISCANEPYTRRHLYQLGPLP
jgi:hypothetical protein